ncbi:toll-like receptor 2 [Haliotis rufescens]|uniref:toll-like receptor 2 n=1 Tax=Haliotis rufescens TaxID=6454 RepID=UPI00201F3227|nr:toll-like receptor 2 [Haliotis rufescens]
MASVWMLVLFLTVTLIALSSNGAVAQHPLKRIEDTNLHVASQRKYARNTIKAWTKNRGTGPREDDGPGLPSILELTRNSMRISHEKRMEATDRSNTQNTRNGFTDRPPLKKQGKTPSSTFWADTGRVFMTGRQDGGHRQSSRPTPNKRTSRKSPFHQSYDIKTSTQVNTTVPSAVEISAESNFCNMSHRGLRSVPPISRCHTLDLSHNSISRISNASFPVPHTELRVLVLRNNIINSFDIGAFVNTSNLQILDLSFNYLSSSEFFPEFVFRPLESLLTLYLHGNMGTSPANNAEYPDRALSMLKRLRNLTLDGYENIALGPGFKSLTSLQYLAFGKEGKSCFTKALYNDTFLYITGPLKGLNMSYCNLQTIQNDSFSGFTWLLYADFNHNINLNMNMVFGALSKHQLRYLGLGSLKQIDTRMTFTSSHLFPCIKDLDLSNDSIVYIEPTFISKILSPCLTTLSLRNNALNSSQSTKALLTALGKVPHLTYLDFSSQRRSSKRYITDKVKSFNSNKSSIHTEQTFVIPNMLYFANFSHSYTGSSEISGSYKVVGAKGLRILDISSNPFNCRSQIEGLESLLYLNMSQSNCYRINMKLFKTFTNLIELRLDNSHLDVGFQDVKDHTLLAPLKSLISISMAQNNLKNLPEDLFTCNQRLSSINLSRNKLTAIPMTWLKLPILRELDLSYNDIKVIGHPVREQLESLAMNGTFKLHLKGNLLSCGCNELEFVKWITSTKVSLDNEDGYNCKMPNGSIFNTRLLNDALGEMELTCMGPMLMIIVICITVPLIVGLLFVSLCYRNRWTLKYIWLKMKMKWGVYVPLIEPTDGIRYDLFVCYSHHETEWLILTLVAKLETELGFKLAFYDRDFLPGNYIREEVVEKLYASRASLFVITETYLESSYCEFEFQMVALRSLEKLSHKIFVIIKDNIPIHRLPFFLQNMWNRVVCLPWTDDETGQAELWRKLDTALRKNRPTILEAEPGGASTEEDQDVDCGVQHETGPAGIPSPVMDLISINSQPWHDVRAEHAEGPTHSVDNRE